MDMSSDMLTDTPKQEKPLKIKIKPLGSSTSIPSLADSDYVTPDGTGKKNSNQKKVKKRVTGDFLPGGDDTNDTNYNSDDSDGNKKKKNRLGKPKTRSVGGRSKKADDEFADMYQDDGGDAHSAGYNAAFALWKNMEAWFGDVTPEDLEILQVVTIPNDEAFTIPKLGVAPKTKFIDNSNDSLLVHAFTSRVLSAMVEESEPFPTGVLGVDADDPTWEYMDENNAKMRDLLETKMKNELRSLGLLEDVEVQGETGGLDHEDDEVCSELRRLQDQLKKQIVVNSELKAKMKERVASTEGARKAQKRKREEYISLDAQYTAQLKQIQSQKKRKKNNVVVDS